MVLFCDVHVGLYDFSHGFWTNSRQLDDKVVPLFAGRQCILSNCDLGHRGASLNVKLSKSKIE